MIAVLKSTWRATFGGYHAWREHRQTIRTRRSIEQALEYVDARWPEARAIHSHSDPVFLVSAGWRAGSTLLQRLLVSGRDILIWGEPYRNSGYVQSLGGSLRSLAENHPREGEDLGDRGITELVNQFIGTLSPQVGDLMGAHIAFFERLYEQPALRSGFKRWGLKETRFSLEHVLYLKRLFPRSKVVFLYRNPFDAYRSYRSFPTFYRSWPDQPVLSARQFGQMWREQVEGILSTSVEHVTVAYEELVKDPVPTTRRLAEFVGSPLDPDVMKIRISGRGKGGRSEKRPDAVPWPERWALARSVGDVATRLGYR